MLLWHRGSPLAAGLTSEDSGGAQASGYEVKRQRALQFLGERWLLHQANAPEKLRESALFDSERSLVA